MLESMEVCPRAWTIIMGLNRLSYYPYKADAMIGKYVEQYKNLNTKKLQIHNFQAIAILQIVLESTINHMPRKIRTKEDGKKVIAMSIPLSFHWNSSL